MSFCNWLRGCAGPFPAFPTPHVSTSYHSAKCAKVMLANSGVSGLEEYLSKIPGAKISEESSSNSSNSDLLLSNLVFFSGLAVLRNTTFLEFSFKGK